MFLASDMCTLVGRAKEFIAPTDPTELSSYVYLLIFVFLNVALLGYRKSLSIGAVIYFLTLALMYAAAFFWEGAPFIFFWIYGAAAFYVILFEGRRVLTLFALMNVFGCLVVIPQAAGGMGNLSLGMFFEDGFPPPLLNVFWELNSMAHSFLLLFGPVFVAVEIYLYLRRRRAKKEAAQEREALLARKHEDPHR